MDHTSASAKCQLCSKTRRSSGLIGSESKAVTGALMDIIGAETKAETGRPMVQDKMGQWKKYKYLNQAMASFEQFDISEA